MRRDDLIAIVLRCQREVVRSDTSVKKLTKRQLYTLGFDDLVAVVLAYYKGDPVQVALIADDIMRVVLRVLELQSEEIRKDLQAGKFPWDIAG